MNLNGESGDWDNLQKNVDLVIADVSEDYGWNFLLYYGIMGEPVEVEVQIGKVPEYVVIPFHQFLFKIKGDLLVPTEEQVLADISMPIRLPKRTQELLQIRMPLGLVCDEPILTIRIPIRTSRWLQSPLQQKLLVIKMPLRVQGLVQPLFSAYRPIKTIKMSMKKLEKRKKQSKVVAEI